MTETWAMQPTKLIKTLQLAAKLPHEPKQPAAADCDLDKLDVQLTTLQKLLLKYLVPRARQGIANREIAKSAIIRSIHKVRIALYHLADLMVEEGRLPERRLLFFMGFDEIHQLIESRNPAIVSRYAKRATLKPDSQTLERSDQNVIVLLFLLLRFRMRDITILAFC